jgi:dipeptidyl aminopeptidase/acylaminoacyl peptidase
MQKILSLVLLCSSIGLAQTPKSYTIEQFYKTTRITGGTFSHDEKSVLVGSNQTGIFNAYDLNLSTGEMKQLTKSEKSAIYPISYFPKDKRFLYTADNNGDEINHIFLADQNGKTIDLTPDAGAKAVWSEWAFDKKSFFYGSNKRDKRFFDIYEMDLATMKPRLVFQNNEAYTLNAVSRDKKFLAMSKNIANDVSEIYLYSVEGKKMTKISDNPGNYAIEAFTPDSKSLYYLTDANAEFKYAVKYFIDDKRGEKAWAEKWDIQYIKLSETGKYMVVGINQDAQNVVKILDTQNNRFVSTPKFSDADISYVNISESDAKMTLGVSSSTSPNNLYYFEVATGTQKQLTNSLNPEIDPKDLATAQVVRYRSFDGLEIPAILYKPLQASGRKKVPALVWVHGGPGGQSRVGFSEQIQFLVNQGYAILAVNNRGSSGYGRTFYHKDDKKHGEDDLQDCIYGKHFLTGLDWIDDNKVGIYGGSYGGFMVMAALTSAPEEFKVGVNLFGVVNWLRTLKSIPAWWEATRKGLYEELGDPNSSDSTRLRKISPLFNTNKIKRPVLVLQGSKDPRVLQVESDEIVAAAKRNNVPTEYVLFADEGHGFVKKENQIKATKTVIEFLERYLR